MNSYAISLVLFIFCGTGMAKERSRNTVAKSKVSVSEVESDNSDPGNDDRIPKEKSRTGKKIVRLKNDEILGDSSEFHRDDKTLSLTIEPIGFTPLFGYGGAIGYYLTPNNILEVSYAGGEAEIFGLKVKNSLTSLRLKSFWGNSFYTNLGLSSRLFSLSYEFSEYDSEGFYTGRTDETVLQNRVLGVDFAIGNRWQWSNFTIGCDWIGIFSPISATGESAARGRNYSESEIADANASLDFFSKEPTSQFLRFYLGFSI